MEEPSTNLHVVAWKRTTHRKRGSAKQAEIAPLHVNRAPGRVRCRNRRGTWFLKVRRLHFRRVEFQDLVKIYAVPSPRGPNLCKTYPFNHWRSAPQNKPSSNVRLRTSLVPRSERLCEDRRTKPASGRTGPPHRFKSNKRTLTVGGGNYSYHFIHIYDCSYYE